MGNAASQYFTGTINTIYAQDSQFGANTTTVYLNGVTATTTTCAFDEGFVSFRIKDDENGKKEISAILTAYSMGKTVQVYVDDAYKTANGRCYMMFVKLF